MGILNYIRKLEDKQSEEYLTYQADSAKAYQDWISAGRPIRICVGKELYFLMEEALNNMIYQTSDGKWKVKNT